MSRKQRAIKILALRKRGWTIERIARHFGIGKSTVSLLLFELRNGTVVKPKKVPVVTTPAIRQRILALYNEGKSTTEIGEIVGCHQVTASAITRKARQAGIVGVSPRWPYSITKAKHNRIVQLRTEGKTRRQIHLLTGATLCVINRVLEHGPVEEEKKQLDLPKTSTKRPTLSEIKRVLGTTRPENEVLGELRRLLRAA